MFLSEETWGTFTQLLSLDTDYFCVTKITFSEVQIQQQSNLAMKMSFTAIQDQRLISVIQLLSNTHTGQYSYSLKSTYSQNFFHQKKKCF